MSTNEHGDRDPTPVGWRQSTRGDALTFTHRETGLRLEAGRTDRESCRPGIDEGPTWAMRCRKQVGEVTTSEHVCDVPTENAARTRLTQWMERINRLSDERNWCETVSVGTVVDELRGPEATDDAWRP